MKFGNQRHIIASCRAEIEKFKKPSTDEAFMALVDKLEKILMDCEAVNLQTFLDHPTMIEKVEEKLPDLIKLKWLEHCEDNGILNGKNAAGLFPRLIKFMLSRKNIADYIVGDPSSSASASAARPCRLLPATVSMICGVAGGEAVLDPAPRMRAVAKVFGQVAVLERQRSLQKQLMLLKQKLLKLLKLLPLGIK